MLIFEIKLRFFKLTFTVFLSLGFLHEDREHVKLSFKTTFLSNITSKTFFLICRLIYSRTSGL